MTTTSRKNEIATEFFTVTDSDNNLVTGIDSTDFTVDIIDPDNNEVSSIITNYITELTNGHYKISFIPNKVKLWYVVIYHSVYFPWGKAGTVNVFNNDFDTIDITSTINIDSINTNLNNIETKLDDVATNLIRALGLMQENYYLDQVVYNAFNCLTSGRMRIYSNAASVGTVNNVIATYQITASYNTPPGDGTPPTMETYKVEKI